MRAAKQRIDQILVSRGLAESREKAKALLLAGAVFVNGQRVDKPGTMIAEDASVEVAQAMPYVSRGGFKLAGALDGFGLNVEGRVCLDVGSSTGGFTDCLLQRGAARVHSVDVGKSQLHWKLRTDPRVIIHEGLNARYLTPADIGEPVQLAVCDVSFISVTLILPVLPPLLANPREIVVLVKPQFEVGREQVGRGGIIRDPALHAWSCDRVRGAAEALGLHTRLMESPLPGAEGNLEFLLYAHDPDSRNHL